MRDWRVREAEGGSARPSEQKTRLLRKRSGGRAIFLGDFRKSLQQANFGFYFSILCKLLERQLRRRPAWPIIDRERHDHRQANAQHGERANQGGKPDHLPQLAGQPLPEFHAAGSRRLATLATQPWRKTFRSRRPLALTSSCRRPAYAPAHQAACGTSPERAASPPRRKYLAAVDRYARGLQSRRRRHPRPLAAAGLDQ